MQRLHPLPSSLARREQMSRVLFPIYLQDAETKAWLMKNGRGYAIDESMSLIGFEPQQEGFEAYAKIFPPPAAPKAAAATPVSTPAAAPAAKPAAAPVPPAPVASTPVVPPPAPAAAPASVDPATGVDIESVIAELKEMYVKENNGKTPDNDMVERWRSEVENLQTTELLNKIEMIKIESDDEEETESEATSSRSPVKSEDVEDGWVKLDT